MMLTMMDVHDLGWIVYEDNHLIVINRNLSPFGFHLFVTLD